MRANYKALDSYGAVQVHTGVASANSIQLIQMLFDGFIESLAIARGHLQRGEIREKSESLTRAGKIVIGLQTALNFEQGGDLAKNLNELYVYVTRRLIHVNAHNDLDALDEVHGLMNEVREAWQTLPDLLRETAPTVRFLS